MSYKFKFFLVWNFALLWFFCVMNSTIKKIIKFQKKNSKSSLKITRCIYMVQVSSQKYISFFHILLIFYIGLWMTTTFIITSQNWKMVNIGTTWTKHYLLMDKTSKKDAIIHRWMKCDHINKSNILDENFNVNELYYGCMNLKCSWWKVTTPLISNIHKSSWMWWNYYVLRWKHKWELITWAKWILTTCMILNFMINEIEQWHKLNMNGRKW